MFRRFLFGSLLLGVVTPVTAQEIVVTPLGDEPLIEIPVEDLDLGLDDEFNPNADEAPLDDLLEELTGAPVEAPREEVTKGPYGVLRVLDKLTGEVTDVELAEGEERELGFLSVAMQECRYPIDNPAGDAFIFVQAFDLRERVDLFSGWMIASAPALNAMDHPRYDIWALRCNIE